MKSTLIMITTVVFTFLMGCISDNKPNSTQSKATKMELTQKEKAVALLKSIETGDQGPVAYIDANNYTQHNLAVADGLAGFGAALQALPPNSAKVITVRVSIIPFIICNSKFCFFPDNLHPMLILKMI